MKKRKKSDILRSKGRVLAAMKKEDNLLMQLKKLKRYKKRLWKLDQQLLNAVD